MSQPYQGGVPQRSPLPGQSLGPPPPRQPYPYPATAQPPQPQPSLPGPPPPSGYYPDPRGPGPVGPRTDLGHPSLIPAGMPGGYRPDRPPFDAPEELAMSIGSNAKTQPQSVEELPAHDPPESVSRDDGERRYKLVVVQQPQRARMCGFGEKDRRPITPPPCVHLIVTDVKTGQEINPNDIEHQMYVLVVDLWTFDGKKEVNLVKHPTNSPSISSGQAVSYKEIAESGPEALRQQFANPAPMHQQMGAPGQPPVQGYQPQAQQGYGQTPYGYPPHPTGSYPGYQPQYQQGVPALPSQPQPFPGRYPTDIGHQRGYSNGQSPANQSITRNLIGSLSSSAAKLNDLSDKIGIWFVLQDLSVRTEGFFRLRFSFTNVGVPGTKGDPNSSDPHRINKGKASVLAVCWSEPFQVYSAKKFPGVCDSTPLSKCFALQGIKIPIRKEGQENKRKAGSADGEDEDED